MNTNANPVDLAKEVLGSYAAIARAAQVQPPTVHEWKSGGRPVPIEKCVLIEQATKGEVTRKMLRPDDWHRIWPELISAKRKPAKT